MNNNLKEKPIKEKPIKEKPIKEKPIKEKVDVPGINLTIPIPYNDITWSVLNGSKWC